MSGKLFDDVFEQAKLTLLRAEEHDVYRRELKEARDLVNQFRTAKKEGHEEARLKSEAERTREAERVAADALRMGLGVAVAARLSKLTEDQVRALADRLGIAH